MNACLNAAANHRIDQTSTSDYKSEHQNDSNNCLKLMSQLKEKYQALLLLSFGGPEGPDDVMPFLRNVLRGKNVPESRMLEVAEHYNKFGGISPINEQNRQLIAAIEKDLKENGIDLPVYFGNRNWHPMLNDTLRQMKKDGVKTALTFFTSAYSCYSGCRQYRENVFGAQQELGESAPVFDKIRMCYNHPLFVEAICDRVSTALTQLPDSSKSNTTLLFTAHSIPLAMANGCEYESQLTETSRLVAESLGMPEWKLVYQSRSGPPTQPWLEPDVCDYLEVLQAEKVENVVIVPVGFLSDHMEVLFDLDVEAKEECERLGINMARAKTVGTHPKFVEMIRELILERAFNEEKRSIGEHPPCHDVCPVGCCQSGRPNATSPV